MMATVMTDKQVKERIEKVAKNDILGCTLVQLEALDNIYVVGNPQQTYVNVVANINYLLNRKLMLEAEN